MSKTVTNNTFNNKPASCADDKAAAKALGGAHAKSQPPPVSPFASGPSAGGGSLAPTPQPDGSSPEDYASGA